MDDAAEYHLSTTSLGKSHPKDENEFKSIVEGEPIDGANGTFKNRQEGICDPILRRMISQMLDQERSLSVSREGDKHTVSHYGSCQPTIKGKCPTPKAGRSPEGGRPICTYLGIIRLTRAEQSLKRVIGGNDKSSGIHKELAGDVEEDKEKVESAEAENDVDLGDGGLLLKVVEGRIFRQLVRMPSFSIRIKHKLVDVMESEHRLAKEK